VIPYTFIQRAYYIVQFVKVGYWSIASRSITHVWEKEDRADEKQFNISIFVIFMLNMVPPFISVLD